MAKPEDTRCRAKVGKGRCTNAIMFDTESDNWLIWCEEHQAQEVQARAEGGPRVVRVDVADTTEEDDEDDE